MAEIQRELNRWIQKYCGSDSSLPFVVVSDQLHIAQKDNKATEWIRVWAVSASRWVCVRMCDCCNCNHRLCGLLRTCLTVRVHIRTVCLGHTCIQVWLEMTQDLLVQAGAVLSKALIGPLASAAWLQTDPGECVTEAFLLLSPFLPFLLHLFSHPAYVL